MHPIGFPLKLQYGNYSTRASVNITKWLHPIYFLQSCPCLNVTTYRCHPLAAFSKWQERRVYTAMTTAGTMHAARLFPKLLQMPLLYMLCLPITFPSINKPCFCYLIIEEAFYKFFNHFHSSHEKSTRREVGCFTYFYKYIITRVDNSVSFVFIRFLSLSYCFTEHTEAPCICRNELSSLTSCISRTFPLPSCKTCSSRTSNITCPVPCSRFRIYRMRNSRVSLLMHLV